MPLNRFPALLAASALAATLIGCGTTPDEPPETEPEAEERLGLPGWYVQRETPEESMVVYGFGVSQAEPDYPDQMRRQARTNAAAEIAEQLTQTIQALNSEYFDRQDLGRDEEGARTRQQLQQSTEQWIDQTLVGVQVKRTDVTEDGRWVVMSQYDLEQDFDAYFRAIGAEDDDGLRSDLRGAAENHLDRLRERVNQ